MGVLTTKLTPENEEPWSVLIITNMINNSETTWGKEHFSQSSKPIEVMSKKESEFLTEKMYWHLKTKIYRNAVFSEKKKPNKKTRSHPGSFGSHSWGSTDETRNSIACSAHNRGLSKRRSSSFFIRRAVTRRADPSPLLKSVGTEIFKPGHDLLKGQHQLKTHISSWKFYYQ